MNTKEFILNVNRRNANTRKPQAMKFLRHKALIEFTNTFTESFVKGEITNYVILADAKKYLLQIPNNPFDLIDGEANAKICSDFRVLCRKGLNIDGELIRLTAKSVSDNRVTYFNAQLGRELIAKAKDKATKEKYQKNLNKLIQLPNRDGYLPVVKP